MGRAQCFGPMTDAISLPTSHAAAQRLQQGWQCRLGIAGNAVIYGGIALKILIVRFAVEGFAADADEV